MIRHITFATDDMIISGNLACKTAKEFGCDESSMFMPDLIDDTFWAFNAEIFTQSRGYGYWLWKPYFIYLNLLQMEEGDYLLYTDAGVEIISDVKPVVAYANPVFLFGNNYNHEHWCKGNVTNEILGVRSDRNQVQASAMVFKVCEESIRFVKRWLMWCQMPDFIDDTKGMDNDMEFSEHRHDQAILTCLAYRYGYKLHWWPAIYNQGAFVYEKGTYTDTYQPIFHHTRKRNNEW